MIKLFFTLLALLFFTACKQVSIQKPRTIKIEKHEFKQRVTATAYTSHHSQTDATPFLAAWNNKLSPRRKSIAVSRDLIKKGLGNGVRVRISGLRGIYTVRDKMNKRWKNKIDIYMGTNRKKALRWGKRKVTIRWGKKKISYLKVKEVKSIKAKAMPKDKQTPLPKPPNNLSLLGL
jgi:3D (Asp-Asp-Asp) domain-containing protein